jgi:hypothetical protein
VRRVCGGVDELRCELKESILVSCVQLVRIIKPIAIREALVSNTHRTGRKHSSKLPSKVIVVHALAHCVEPVTRDVFTLIVEVTAKYGAQPGGWDAVEAGHVISQLGDTAVNTLRNTSIPALIKVGEGASSIVGTRVPADASASRSLIHKGCIKHREVVNQRDQPATHLVNRHVVIEVQNVGSFRDGAGNILRPLDGRPVIAERTGTNE